MVFEKIRAIICEQLSVGEDEVTLSTNLEDLGADELDMVDIAMSIEDDFRLEISEEVLDGFVTVEDIVNFIDEN